MIVLPSAVRFALRANDIARRAATGREPDPRPVLKLYNPLGAATWLATELGEDDDVLFGLADLGFGCPELGYFSLSEIASVRLPYGLFIERDEDFDGLAPLSRWADLALVHGPSSPPSGCCAPLRLPNNRPTIARQGFAATANARRVSPHPKPVPPILQDQRDRYSQGVRPMKLDFIPLDKLTVSKTNMRHRRKAPDVADILPSVRTRGVLVPLIVRPASESDMFEIVAGLRRYTAANMVAEETGHAEPLPAAIIEPGDDAAALEASLLENIARLDPDEVTQWETFVRLVREGRKVEDIVGTFGLPEQMVRRVLALGNLLPRIRDLYRREKIDAAMIRHLTMASKQRQRDWLALFDDPEQRAPTGYQLKGWLFGGTSVPTSVALFDMADYPGQIVATLFGEEAYFADVEQFWTAQMAAVEVRRQAYLEAGWSDVIVVPVTEHFHTWEHERFAKRKGGRVYIDVRSSGEVTFHEGYLSRKEAHRLENAETGASGSKPARPEITSTMQTYIDLHRHSAVRADLLNHPAVALRLMVAHAIVGSHLWRVSADPRTSRNEDVTESAEGCHAEASFDQERRVVLGLLGFSAEEPTVTGGNGDDYGVAGLFFSLLAMPDEAVMRIIPVIMGETLVAGSAAIDAVGNTIGTDMANWWSADAVFFELIRDKEVLTRIVAEVAGEMVASANAGEKTKTLKGIVRAYLDRADGRPKVERWVPRWMRFAPSAYTERGGVATVSASNKVEAARAALAEPAAKPDKEMVEVGAEIERLAA